MDAHPESGGLSLLFESPPGVAGKGGGRNAAAPSPPPPVVVVAEVARTKDSNDERQHVFVAPSPPRSQGRARPGRAGALRAHTTSPSDVVSFEDLVSSGLVRVGDELECLGLSCIVLRDGWLETKSDKLTLESFVLAAVQKCNKSLSLEERQELRLCGAAAYKRIDVVDSQQQGSKTLWSLSETYLRNLSNVGALEAKSKAAALSLSLHDEVILGSSDAQAHISTQLPLSDGGDVVAAAPPMDLDAEPAPQHESTPQSKAPRRAPLSQQPRSSVSVAAKSSSLLKSDKKRARTQQSPPPKTVIVIDSSDEPATPIARLQQQQRHSANKSAAKRLLLQPEEVVAREDEGLKRSKVDADSLLPELEDARLDLQLDLQLLELVRGSGQQAREAVHEAPDPAAAAAAVVTPPTRALETVSSIVARSTSHNKPRSFVLTCSGLRTKALELVKQHCIAMRAQMESGWSPNVTHVIMAVAEDGRCKRTVKYMQGVLSGKFVLTFAWIGACVAARAWVDEQPYLVQDDSAGGHKAPEAMLRRFAEGSGPLFRGLRFFFWGSFEGRSCSKADLEQIAAAGGAALLDAPPGSSLDDAEYARVVVICSDELTQEEAERVWAETGHDGVSFQWLFDCASHAELLSLTHNAKYKKTFNEDVAGDFAFHTQNSPAL